MKPFLATLLAVNAAPTDTYRNAYGRVTVQVPNKVTLLHTNVLKAKKDIHCHLQQFNGFGTACSAKNIAENKCYGGVARLKHVIDGFRANTTDVVLLDAGDQFQGTMFFNAFGGAKAAEVMNILKYDVMTIGNHEFDDGLDELSKFINNLKFPVVNSNINFGYTKLSSIVQPYFIIEKYKIGVIGYITKDTAKLVSKGFTAGLTFVDPVIPVQKAVDELRAKGITRIICVSHNGYFEDMGLAKNTTGIHLIVGGHSHSLLSNDATLNPEGPYPTAVKNSANEVTYVVQAHRYGDYLGHVELEWDSQGKLSSIDGLPILMNQDVPIDRELDNLVNEWAKEFVKFDNDILTVATDDFDGNCKFNRCPLAELIGSCLASEQRARGFEVDGAFFNGGGIRSGIQKGDVSVTDVMTALPFNNNGMYFSYQGAKLLDLIERSASLTGAIPDHEGKLVMGSLPQFSGVTFKIDASKPPSSRTGEVMVNGKPIDPDKIYKFVSIDFVTTGGDNLIIPVDGESNGDLMSDTVISCFRKKKSISPVFETESMIVNATESPVLSGKQTHAAAREILEKRRARAYD